MVDAVIDGELDFDLECNQECEPIVEDVPLTKNERKRHAWLMIETKREQRELNDELDYWG